MAEFCSSVAQGVIYFDFDPVGWWIGDFGPGDPGGSTMLVERTVVIAIGDGEEPLGDGLGDGVDAGMPAALPVQVLATAQHAGAVV